MLTPYSHRAAFSATYPRDAAHGVKRATVAPGRGRRGPLGIPHITAKPDGSVHLLLPSDGRAIMDELQDTLTPGQFELHGGWRDVTVYMAEAHTAVRIVLRHCPHADDASQGVKP
jgi:hypothetical protein